MSVLTREYLDRQLEKQAQMIARGFANTATKEDIKRLEQEIQKLKQEIQALSNKLTRYMELSDKRYLELKHKSLVIARWVKKIADKTGVQIDLAELDKF